LYAKGPLSVDFVYGRIYNIPGLQVGQTDLALGASYDFDVVKAVQSGNRVLVSGFHDASGDPAKNAELARQRAMAVGAALKMAGVPEDKVELAKPAQTTADGPPAEARRVEVKVQ